MRDIWFISDTHFGHRNIIQFTKEDGSLVRPHPSGRPFESIEEHDELLIENWNKRVKDGDKIYHLGDITINPKRDPVYLSKLRGVKRLIMGNHDIAKPEVYASHFGKVMSCREFDGMILTHVPVHYSQLESRWRVNVHGHLHSTELRDYQYLNVCVEHTNMAPLHLDELRDRINA